MKKTLAIAVLMALAVSSSGGAQTNRDDGTRPAFVSGLTLVDQCFGKRPTNESVCMGYVSGVADAMIASSPVLCFPANTDINKLRDVARNHLLKYPAAVKEPAVTEVMKALMLEFACKQKK